MSRVTHFEILATDPERAETFYSQVFNWEFKKWDGPMDYWLIMTGVGDSKAPGIDGGMMRREGEVVPDMQTSNGFVCTVDVEDIDSVLSRVEASGGMVTKPKGEIPGVGWHAYCKDTEGNFFGVMESAGSPQ